MVGWRAAVPGGMQRRRTGASLCRGASARRQGLHPPCAQPPKLLHRSTANACTSTLGTHVSETQALGDHVLGLVLQLCKLADCWQHLGCHRIATRHQNSPPCNTVNCQVRCFSFVQQPKVQGCPCSCGNGGGDSSSQEEAHTAQHQRCPPMDRSRLPLRAHSLTLRAVRAQALLTGGRRHAAVAWQGKQWLAGRN